MGGRGEEEVSSGVGEEGGTEEAENCQECRKARRLSCYRWSRSYCMLGGERPEKEGVSVISWRLLIW